MVHQDLKTSSFAIVYNRIANQPEDYSKIAPISGEDEVVKAWLVRRDAIQMALFPAVKDRLRQANIKTKKRLDKSRNIIEERIAPGSFVMLKDLFRSDKLAPYFEGPFRVLGDGEFKTNAYRLQDNAGNLTREVPREAIRLIRSSSINESDLVMRFGDSADIEKILDHRTEENGEVSYLVKWKMLDETENEWVAYQDFDDISCIRKYHGSRKASVHLKKKESKILNKGFGKRLAAFDSTRINNEPISDTLPIRSTARRLGLRNSVKMKTTSNSNSETDQIQVAPSIHVPVASNEVQDKRKRSLEVDNESAAHKSNRTSEHKVPRLEDKPTN
jgi:hypothetical protein